VTTTIYLVLLQRQQGRITFWWQNIYDVLFTIEMSWVQLPVGSL